MLTRWSEQIFRTSGSIGHSQPRRQLWGRPLGGTSLSNAPWVTLSHQRGTGGVSSPGRLGQGGTQGSIQVACQGQYGGVTPGFSLGGNPGQQPRRAGWFDQCHPKFTAMMDTYLDLTQGHLQLTNVLNASGKQQMDIPTLPKYTHPNGRPFLCWSCILSQ
jgi:hypothetical protein